MDPGSPGSTDALQQLYATLQRYAGWLDRERTSVMVRADVQALGAAIQTSADPSPQLQSLDTNIARLPSGELRKMLRVAASQMRRALGGAMTPTEVEELVRSVIVHIGLPFAVLSVVESPFGWSIQVRAGTGGVVRFTVLGGRPLAMRIAIQEKLEAEL